MKDRLKTLQNFLVTYKKDLAVGAGIIIGVGGLITLVVVLFIKNNVPAAIVYQPAAACELLTLDEAKSLLGTTASKTGEKSPVLSGHLVKSECGYTVTNPDTQNIVVAAIVVRSGIDDKGVAQNIAEFTNGVPATNVEVVKDLGDRAYFNYSLGQLNVLKERDWIIFSYGIGSDPQGNTIEDAVALAQKTLR